MNRPRRDYRRGPRRWRARISGGADDGETAVLELSRNSVRLMTASDQGRCRRLGGPSVAMGESTVY
jgi:hypothetical protein